MLVANTATETSLLDEQGVEISPNVWQHVPFKHEEAGIVAEPQILPEGASEYVMVKDVGGLSLLSSIPAF